MAFLSYLIETVVKMVLVAAVAVGGIFLGKYLRDRKENKEEK